MGGYGYVYMGEWMGGFCLLGPTDVRNPCSRRVTLSHNPDLDRTIASPSLGPSHAPSSELFDEVVTTESRHFPRTRPNTACVSVHPQRRPRTRQPLPCRVVGPSMTSLSYTIVTHLTIVGLFGADPPPSDWSSGWAAGIGCQRHNPLLAPLFPGRPLAPCHRVCPRPPLPPRPPAPSTPSAARRPRPTAATGRRASGSPCSGTLA